MNSRNTEVREFIGVLVEDIERNGNRIPVHILLQSTDEEEYHFLDEAPLRAFLRQRVRILGTLHVDQGKKVLEVLQINPVQLTGSLE
jgi:hypothetical protein